MTTIHTLLACTMIGLSGLTFAIPAAATDVKTKDQINAEYDTAKEKCNAFSGKEAKACKARAQADRDNALVDAKFGKAEAEAKRDLADKHRDADYEAAKAQCDTLSGDAKDKCKAEAKTEYAK